MNEVPRRTSLAPLASPRFLFCLIGGGNRRVFRLAGEGGDHFHCTVDPSPGHIRCREFTKRGEFMNRFAGDMSIGPLGE